MAKVLTFEEVLLNQRHKESIKYSMSDENKAVKQNERERIKSWNKIHAIGNGHVVQSDERLMKRNAKACKGAKIGKAEWGKPKHSPVLVIKYDTENGTVLSKQVVNVVTK